MPRIPAIILQLLPELIPVLTSGTTTSVTFSGEYFGTNPPTLQFSPSAGISYTLTNYSDTQIQASVNVASGTPDEDVYVSVTSNGYGGNAFSSTNGASATSGPVYATVQSPKNTPEVTVIAWVNGQSPDIVATVAAGPRHNGTAKQPNDKLDLLRYGSTRLGGSEKSKRPQHAAGPRLRERMDASEFEKYGSSCQHLACSATKCRKL